MSPDQDVPPGAIPVRNGHEFDVSALAAYLRDKCPQFSGNIERLLQFQGGQVSQITKALSGTRFFFLDVHFFLEEYFTFEIR
jgi:hypothetical protein